MERSYLRYLRILLAVICLGSFSIAFPTFTLVNDVSAAPALSGEPIAPDWVSRCSTSTVPFETQSWWAPDFGHVHAGFCAPQGKTISGKYTFNVRLVLHDNPGTLTMLKTALDSTSYGREINFVNLTCPGGNTCAWDRQVSIDTAAFPYDGWHHIRVMAVVKEPDGKEMVATSFIPVYLKNGKLRKDLASTDLLINTTSDYIAGRGWYTDAGYNWSVLFDPRRAGERVSGVYKVRVRSAAGSNPQPVSRFIVKLDATHTAAGTTLHDIAGPQPKPVELSIDTRKLSNGWHSLLARTESANQVAGSCAVCSGQKQTAAGVTKVWFYVQN